MNDKQALSITEFAKRFGLCRESVYAQARAGRLRIVKAGKRSLIMTADAEAWAANLPELKLPATA
jgi:excisionase family DNA binding protein